MTAGAFKGSPVPPARKPAGLAGTLEANRKPILLAAAGAVAVVALLRRRSAGSSSAAGADATPATFAGQSTAGGPYDTSGTDVYNALQPQIEQTQGMLQGLLDRLGPAADVTPTPTTPEPGRIPTPAPPTPAPAPPPRTTPAPTPKPSTTTYVVRKGDNLTAIAKRYGTSWHTIYAQNRGVIGSNPNLILPGQRLVLTK